MFRTFYLACNEDNILLCSSLWKATAGKWLKKVRKHQKWWISKEFAHWHFFYFSQNNSVVIVMSLWDQVGVHIEHTGGQDGGASSSSSKQHWCELSGYQGWSGRCWLGSNQSAHSQSADASITSVFWHVYSSSAVQCLEQTTRSFENASFSIENILLDFVIQ